MSRSLLGSLVWALALALTLTPGVSRAELAMTAVAGEWAGDWSGNGEKGWMSLTVDPAGAFTGLVASRTGGGYGPVDGRIEASGAMRLNLRFAGQELQLTGTARPSKSSLAISLSMTDNETGEVQRVRATVKRWDPSVPIGKYAGEWAGTWSARGIKGTLRLAISADGRVAGEIGGSDTADAAEFTGRLLPNGLFLSDQDTQGGPRVSVSVGDARVANTSMTFAFYITDARSGDGVTIRVSMKRQTGASPWQNQWQGSARTRQGVILELTLNIDDAGRARGLWRNTDDGSRGELVMLVAPNGAFSGFTLEGGAFSEFIFGTFKRARGGDLGGSGTVLDLERVKTGFTLTLSPA